MLIKLKSIATNVNYDTDKLKEYYKILTEAGYEVKVFNELDLTERHPEHINNNTFLEIEIENVINRSRATAVIYSTKKKDVIKKVEDKLPTVKYFIQMNSDDELEGREVGFNTIVKQGKEMLKDGDDSFMKIEVDPEEFKVLIFTSGTTSNSKGVMLCNRNLAENINAVSPYVKIYETDRFFSVLPLHHTYESSIGFLLPMAKGSSIAICQGLKHIVPDLKETNPTAMLAVPLLIESLYKKINQTIEKSGK